jgi:replicative DNA helicase
VVDLHEQVPLPSNVQWYAHLITAANVRRQAAQVGHEILRMAPSADLPALAERLRIAADLVAAQVEDLERAGVRP